MAHLMEFRRRIRAIQSIKKISHAMRLVAMSMHSRLKNLESQLHEYREIIDQLIAIFPQADPQIFLQPSMVADRQLVILVGSQKGLCGMFNTGLLRFYQQSVYKESQGLDIITVGKYMHQMMSKKPILEMHESFAFGTFIAIAHSLAHRILDTMSMYRSVVLVSNVGKGFFSQEPHATSLVPYVAEKQNNQEAPETDQSFIQTKEWYIQEQPQLIVERVIRHFVLATQIQTKLFESLVAEQAARFLTMDSATNNAEEIIQKMRIDLNKLRQASITRELAELTAGL